MDTPQSFLEKHKGFVLKLRLVGVGGKSIEIDPFSITNQAKEKIEST